MKIISSLSRDDSMPEVQKPSGIERRKPPAHVFRPPKKFGIERNKYYIVRQDARVNEIVSGPYTEAEAIEMKHLDYPHAMYKVIRGGTCQDEDIEWSATAKSIEENEMTTSTNKRKVIIATAKQIVTAAKANAKAPKAASNTQLGSIRGLIQDISDSYEELSIVVDRLGERIDEIESVAQDKPLTAEGVKSLNTALKDFAKILKTAVTATEKADKVMAKTSSVGMKAVIIAPKTKEASEGEETAAE